MIFFGDLETFCEKPLKHGTFQYAEACEVMLFSFAIDDGPVKVLDFTDYDAALAWEIEEALLEADEIVFQNSMFDRTVFRLSKNSLPVMREVGEQVERWRDTMVQALTHSLPGGLEKLGDVLKVEQDQRKLKIGKELVRLFCMPRPKNMKLRRATRQTHPVEWAQFVEYAGNDILAMRSIYKKCPKWNYCGTELAYWHLDQHINDRGVCVDLDLAKAAIGAVKIEQARLKEMGQEATAGWLESLTKRDKLLEYILMEHGINLPDLRKDTLERRIEDPDLPIELRNLLALRLMATTTSTSKYNAVVRGVSSDGRLRGLLQFAGANRTARWAGRLFQPQNLPRPDMDQDEIEQCIDAIKDGGIDLISDNVMRACSNAIRGVITAPPGKKLVVGDLANIEGRMAAWLASEDWKLQAFRDYDAGTGPDLYKVAYAKAFAILVDLVTKPQRQIGKVMELMLQYEGGVGAFITGAATYGIDLDEMATAALPNVPADVLKESTEFYDWTVKKKRSTFGLSRDTFIACDALKRLWRYAHPAISSYWGELKEKVTAAINKPGETFIARRLKIRRDGAWLKIRLPSGRFLCYPSPQVDDKGQISYMGVNQYSRQWSRIKTYGGKIFENITQAAARDALAYNMPAIEEDGFEIILTVHDEDITEAPDTPDYSVDRLCALMATVPHWAEGLPLSSAGFEGYRYRKD
ncbi:DNA polymerase I [Propionivibrio dicarboxylicus]|uniref:DNA polymerase n=1 Tax=Propionivibrio dicarboxylicus TaxID=83767 RepID=A0A1G8C8M2_9RHOO|nr:DNA polymerase I [Propionivibrio dicarboxylicus]SDH41738.1 DNA polymerase [Propionivibrio dicarboxylicus]